MEYLTSNQLQIDELIQYYRLVCAEYDPSEERYLPWQKHFSTGLVGRTGFLRNDSVPYFNRGADQHAVGFNVYRCGNWFARVSPHPLYRNPLRTTHHYAVWIFTDTEGAGCTIAKNWPGYGRRHVPGAISVDRVSRKYRVDCGFQQT